MNINFSGYDLVLDPTTYNGSACYTVPSNTCCNQALFNSSGNPCYIY